MEQNQNFLATEKVGKLMRKYSLPCILSLVTAALYNIVDQLFIANASYLGAYGNAANNVVFPLTMVALATATMIGDGCCTFVSISLGKKEPGEAHRSIGNAIVWTLGISLVITAFYLLCQTPILLAFGADVNEETLSLSKEYFFWITLGIPFYMFGQAMNPVIRSDGSPKYAMLTLLAGAVLNIIFDPICIYSLRWGMMGAAVATVFGQVVSALLSLMYLFKMKSVHLCKESFGIDLKYIKQIVTLGATSFLTQISVVISMAAVLNMIKKYGALDPVFGLSEYAHIPTAVVGIVMKLFQIIISVAIGLAAGCIPVVGYNTGAGRNDRVYEIMKRLIAREFIIGLVSSAVFLVFTGKFVLLFGGENESVYYNEFSVKCIRIFLSMLSLACVNKGITIFMQSLGRAKDATFLSMLREIVLGVGLPVILPVFGGLNGLLFFMPLADIVTVIFSLLYIIKLKKFLTRPAL